MDLSLLLERIGYTEAICKLDVAALDELCAAFLCSVPYQSTCFSGDGGTLRLEKVYDAVVMQQRGGSSHELNSLFCWMLACIGFDVRMIKVTPYLEDSFSYAKARGMALMVTMRNGEERLVDIGCGERSFLSSLSMDLIGIEQAQASGVYRIRRQNKEFILEKKRRELLTDEGKKVPLHSEEDEIPSNERKKADYCPLFRFSTDGHQIEAFRSDFLEFQRENPMHKCLPKVTMHYQRDSREKGGRESGVKILAGDVFTKIEYTDALSMKVLTVQKAVQGDIRDEFKIPVPAK